MPAANMPASLVCMWDRAPPADMYSGVECGWAHWLLGTRRALMLASVCGCCPRSLPRCACHAMPCHALPRVQEEFLLSACTAFAVCNLLGSLTADNAQVRPMAIALRLHAMPCPTML